MADLAVPTVAVRALAAFTAKQGDLDLRFTPAPTARQGQFGHVAVGARRDKAGYEREVSLAGDWTVEGEARLHVRGRADGFDAAAGRLDEVKTHRGRLERQPANHRHLHWAQARLYAGLLCRARGLAALEVALVYYDVDTGAETVFAERHDAASLQAHFERCCRAYHAWAVQEAAHRRARDAALADLRFPHDGFRAGQRRLAEQVYRAARAGRVLLAEAPTGIGKTMGTLFPMLKAAGREGLDRVVYATAKTSGRALALEAVGKLRTAHAGLPLRTLELVARDKACVHPERACHGTSCPLASGFYDRLPAARAAALSLPVWHGPAVQALAAEHEVCPYYLAQELARWADLVIGDYHHWFSRGGLLQALAAEQDWRVGLLVDEAHNLVPRGQALYSASWNDAALRVLPKPLPAALKSPIAQVRRRWNELSKAGSAAVEPGGQGEPADYTVLAALPRPFLDALAQAAAALAEEFAAGLEAALAEGAARDGGRGGAPMAGAGAGAGHPALQQFYLDAIRLAGLVEDWGDHSIADLERGAGGPVLTLRNLVPAPFVGPRLRAARSAVLFSATLTPPGYYRDMLGLPDDAAELTVPAPFSARQLEVRVARGLSTRWADRPATLGRLVERIAAQHAARPGNYLAFFGSHDYLDEAAGRLAATHPEIAIWRQTRRMSEPEQAAFLARFEAGGSGVGFAVLGGSFAEGVDLPGRRLIGAFIATLGLPRIGPVTEELRRRLEQRFGRGFEYAYLYPGLQKVVQAAGRVIRTPEDEGVVHLLDQRYLERRVQRLLPAWWDVDGRGGPG